ncbi:MAG: hypothetical protein KDJ65_16070 [Anaerolineae bacterium]|nr:hypothetical protein [Anaerolineae bacterium]
MLGGGTGDIGPTLFELAGNKYALELAMSDKLGNIAPQEYQATFVVSK